MIACEFVPAAARHRQFAERCDGLDDSRLARPVLADKEGDWRGELDVEAPNQREVERILAPVCRTLFQLEPHEVRRLRSHRSILTAQTSSSPKCEKCQQRPAMARHALRIASTTMMPTTSVKV